MIKACLYEPQVNRSYAEMAAHYDTAVLPARPRRPRDKAKVEAAVLIEAIAAVVIYTTGEKNKHGNLLLPKESLKRL